MSRRFLLTPAARSDLIEIDEYLRRESMRAAAAGEQLAEG